METTVTDPIQADTTPCKECGSEARVTPTADPYDFEWVCRCGMCGVISWVHEAPPPKFARQAGLFAEHEEA